MTRAHFPLSLIPLVALVLGTACASTGKYKKVLDSWVGSDVSNLMQSWGPPSQSYRMPDGRMLYTWTFNGGVVAAPIGNSVYAAQRWCRTTFTTDAQNKIVNWQFEGNACTSR